MDYLILVDAILILVIFGMLAIFHRRLLNCFDDLITDLRFFIYKNDSFFTILFLFIFFIQQLILIIFGHIFREDVIRLQILISIFALIVVTTSSLQKLVLDIRVRHFRDQSIAFSKLYYSNEKILEALKKILKK